MTHSKSLRRSERVVQNRVITLGLEHTWPHRDRALPDFRYSDSTITFTYIGGPRRWACLKYLEEDLQHGRGVKRGDHHPPYKYIKNTYTCGTTPTAHLLNAGRRPQTYKKQWADRVLVFRPGGRPEPLRWESWVLDIGPPETSCSHVIQIGKTSPRDLHLNTKTQLHSTTSKLQCWTPHVKQLAREENNPTHWQTGCLKS